MREEGRTSFEEWARARQDSLVRAAYLLTGDFARAEDLVQEALIKAALRWDTLRDGQPEAWIRTVIYRDHVSWWRRTRRERLTADPPEAVRSSPIGDADVAVSLRAALRTLTPKQRANLVLRYVEDLSVDETARVRVVTPGTVKRQAAVARQRLRGLSPGLLEEIR
jgi:RNA polymerase sigma-70 factor (sigma-E family)